MSGPRGPRPVPTNLKLLRGNPGHQVLNTNEPQPLLAPDPPRPPAYLDGHAAEEWDRLAAELYRLKLLTIVDVAALAAYEKQRLEATTRVVLTNRTNPPDAILREVYQRNNDRPFADIDDVISREELVALSDGYKRIAGYSRDALRR